MHRRDSQQVKFVYVDQTTEEQSRIFYVGKGNAVRVRNLKRNKKHSAITERYGLKRTVILETCDEQEANNLEIAKIAEYRTLARTYSVSDDDFGCNFTCGGEGFSGISDVERLRRSERMKTRWADQNERAKLVQVQNSETTRSKKSRAMKKWVSTEEGREHLHSSLNIARVAFTYELRKAAQNHPETKKLKSQAMKDYCSNLDVKQKKSIDAQKNWVSQEYREKQRTARAGWKPTEEHKQRISEKLKGHVVSDVTKEKMRLKRIAFIERKKQMMRYEVRNLEAPRERCLTELQRQHTRLMGNIWGPDGQMDKCSTLEEAKIVASAGASVSESRPTHVVIDLDSGLEVYRTRKTCTFHGCDKLSKTADLMMCHRHQPKPL